MTENSATNHGPTEKRVASGSDQDLDTYHKGEGLKPPAFAEIEMPPLRIWRKISIAEQIGVAKANPPEREIPTDLNQPKSFLKALRLRAVAIQDVELWQFLTSLSKRELCEILCEVSGPSRIRSVYAHLQKQGRV